MYTAHFGFRFDPFEPGYRPDRYFDACQCRNAIELLHSAISAGDSIMILSGPSGSGKTTLLKQFAKTPTQSRILLLEDGGRTFEDVVDQMFAALGLQASSDATGEKLKEIYVSLRDPEDSSNPVLLVVDNADKLPAIAIKQISYLVPDREARIV